MICEPWTARDEELLDWGTSLNTSALAMAAALGRTVEDIERHRRAMKHRVVQQQSHGGRRLPKQNRDCRCTRTQDAEAPGRDSRLEDEVLLSQVQEGPRVDPFGIDPLLEALKTAHGHEPIDLRDVVCWARKVAVHGRRGR
jgi:hypothetical protein